MAVDLKVFDVEHGACALLTADNNARMLIDCGHNASTSWRPGTYLKESGVKSLEVLAVTNYDEDHVTAIGNVLDSVSVQWLYRNGSVSAGTIKSLKSETGMGPGIDRLVSAIQNDFTGTGTSPLPTFQGVNLTRYSNSYPTFQDENNLSMVMHLNCHGRGIMFTGDLEKAGWLELLKREDFRNALRSTDVLVASHHGRESGCCEEVFQYCKPYYVVISDKGYMYDTQKTVPFYRKFAKGGPFRGQGTRHVLTTRNDGRIGFLFKPGEWYPY